MPHTMKQLFRFRFDKKMLRCPACGSRALKYAFTSPNGADCIKGFKIDRCSKCHLHFVNPQPNSDSLLQFYSSFDQGLVTDLRKCFSPYYRKRLLHDVVTPLKRYVRTGDVLDCGCGMGMLVKVLQGAGFSSYGIDFSEESLKVGREKLKLTNLERANLLDYRTSRRFDAITAIHVLEHLKNPRAFFEKASDLLRKNGLLMLSYPSSDSLQFSQLGKHYNWLLAPYHLFYFSRASVDVLLKQCGFRLIAEEHIPVNWHWARSIANSLGFVRSYNEWRRNSPKFVRYTMEIDKIFDAIAYESNRSSIVNVFAKKIA